MTQSTNPFVFPGFGQPGDATQNPMLASMEMMRKAWESLASTGTGGLDQALATPGVSPEDLERRITDLRAVENWLRMNLSMLSSTIQALEVQRATVSTMQAFVASATDAASSVSAMPSPLDVALGIHRSSGAGPSADSSGLFGAAPSAPTAAEPEAPEAPEAVPPAAEEAIQTWWDMLQTQFDNLASATTATMQSAEAMQNVADSGATKKSESTPTPAAAKSASVKKTVAKKAVKKSSTKKTAAKKSTAKKTTARKASSKSASAGKTATARKASAKKTTAKKAASKQSAAQKATGPGASGASSES